MEFAWHREESVLIATATLGRAAPTPVPPRALLEMLEDSHTKSLIIKIYDTKTPTIAEAIGGITQLLETATVPTAAVITASASEAGRRIANQCNFVYGTTAEAKKKLIALTESRPPHVIRAIMRAFAAGQRLPTEQALMVEARLFSTLAVEKQQRKERGLS